MYRFFMESIREAKTLGELRNIVKEIHASEILDKSQTSILFKYAIGRMKQIDAGKIINTITEILF